MHALRCTGWMLSVISQSCSICRSEECLQIPDGAPFAGLLGSCWAIVSLTLDYERESETPERRQNRLSIVLKKMCNLRCASITSWPMSN